MPFAGNAGKREVFKSYPYRQKNIYLLTVVGSSFLSLEKTLRKVKNFPHFPQIV